MSNSNSMAASPSGASSAERVLPDAKARQRLYGIRKVKDKTSTVLVSAGGVSVIVALALIFVYLFSEVLPMLAPASTDRVAEYQSPGLEGVTAALGSDRFRYVGFRLSESGQATFFQPESGSILSEIPLQLPDDVAVTSRGYGESRTRLTAMGLSDGTAMVVRDSYEDNYDTGEHRVLPSLQFPVGETPVEIDPEGRALTAIGIQEGGRGLIAAAATEDGRLLLVTYQARTNFMTGETVLEPSARELPRPDFTVRQILLDISHRDMIIADDQGRLHYYDVQRPDQARLVHTVSVVEESGAEVTAINYLLGTVSVIVGASDGSLTQWFLVRGEDNVRRLTRVRSFEPHPAEVTVITQEFGRKGFATGDAAGNIAIHFPTSHRTLLQEKVSDAPIRMVVNAPRANGLYIVDSNEQYFYYNLRNPHPQVSISALWDKVWYEGRSEGDYVWQSSSATDEFESKFSLVPLTVGTLKAAFYAMLFAMPLAICGAVYSAYFMSPKMRGLTKPAIEIMEALPTVILGFLAGLWFAPYVERNLPAIFSILVLLPLAMVATSYLWSLMPTRIKQALSGGWEAAILIPVIIAVGWFCAGMSPFLELWFFNGDMRQWLTDSGYTYDQRNAMVVGLAMGFAVIPTIFSIAEDAVFNVPKHLTQGSLALGATTWQTVTKVVLLTASPGIFSAIMIGFGRAVGETMIVLMATGNSPVVNFNIFEGMRTLSANIAVELPEAEFGGTHYRILFLAGLVLFVLTFALNTAAEVVRNRLRKKYASM